MLILAGVSLNAIIGDNGIITNAQDAKLKSGMAVLEEFLQQKYVDNYDSISEQESKVLALMAVPSASNYFYKPVVGALKYVIDSEGHALYLINKNRFARRYKRTASGRPGR